MAQGGRIDYTVGFNIDKKGLNDLKVSLNELKQLGINDLLKINTDMTQKEARSLFNVLQRDIAKINTAFDDAFNPTTGVTNIEKLNQSLKKINIKDMADRFTKAGEAGVTAFNSMTKKAIASNIEFKKTETLLNKIGETLGNTIKWNLSSSLVNRFTNSISQAYGYVQHLDSSLNDIRIVTGKSADEMERFAIQANKTAQALGRSTTQATEAALIYYQQGLSDEETQARMETTLKAANVTGQSTAAVSEELTAVWNGYKVSTEETEASVDKLAAVAATTASDLQELSTGMSKVASAANAMGVDMDQLNAQIATIISVTRQAPESVGTALKTIYARLADLKLGDTDEDGLGLGDVSGTLEKVGVAVLDANGDLREMGDVIEDVAAKWNTWTSAQQTAIAEVMAGKRQYNNLVALFENWDMYSNALDTSRNSLGTLQNQQDIYMESTEAHIQMLKTEWEDLYDSLIDTEGINKIADSLTFIVDKFAAFIDSIGGGKGALLSLGGVALTVFKNQFGAQLGQAIINMRGAKEEAKQLAAQQAAIQTFAEAQNKSPVYAKALIESQRAASQYYDVLNTEQIQNLTNLSIEVAEAAEIADTWNKNTEAVNKYVQALSQAHLTSGDVSNFDATKLGTDQRDVPNVENVNKSFDNVDKELNSIDKIINKIVQGYDKLRVGNETWAQAFQRGSFENKFNKIKASVQDLENHLETLQSAGLITEKQKNEILGFFKGFKGTADEFKLNTTNAIRNITKGINKSKDSVNDLTNGVRETNNTMRQTVEQAQSLNHELSQAEEIARTKLNAALQDAVIKNLTSSVIGLAGGISQFGAGITSIKAGFDTLSNSDLSWTDRILRFLTSFSMGTVQFISSINAIKKGFNGITDGVYLLNDAELAAIGIKLGLANATEMEAIAKDKDKAAALRQLLVTEDLKDTELIETLVKAGLIKETEKETLAQDADALAAWRAKIAHQGLNKELIKEAVLKKANQLFTGLKNVVTKLGTSLLHGKESITLFGKTLGPTAIGLTAVATAAAAVTAGVIGYKLWRGAVEEAAAEAAAFQKQCQQQTEELKEQKNKVEELVKSYKELRDEYGEDNIEDLRIKTYELCRQYGEEDLAIKSLTASYEDLNVMMGNLQKTANQEYLDSIQREQNAITNKINADVWKNMDKSQRDYMWLGRHAGERTIDVSGLGAIQRNVFDFSGKSDLVDDLLNLGIEVDASGHINLDKFIEVAATKTDELTAILTSSSSKGAKELLDLMSTYSEDITRMHELAEEELKANSLSLVNPDDIQSVEQYRQAIEKLTQSSVLLEHFEGDVDAAREWARNWLGAIDTVVQYASRADLEDSLSKALSLDVDSLSKYSDKQLNFLIGKEALAQSFDNLDEFYDYYEDVIDAANNKEIVIKIGAVLASGNGNTSFSQEALEDLFNSTSISNYANINLDQFQRLSFEEQKDTLKDWVRYANEKYHEDYDNFMATNKEKVESLESQATTVNTIAKKYGISDTLKVQAQNYLDLQIRLYGSAEAAAEAIGEDFINIQGYAEEIKQAGIDINQVGNALSELNAIEETFSEGAYLNTISQQFADSTESIKELQQAFEDGIVNLADYTSRYEELNREQDLAGLDIEELNEYSEYLQEVATSSADLADTLVDDEAAADVVSKSIVKMNKGVEDLASNFENWSDILQNSSKMSKEYADALNGSKKAMASLLDISEDYVSEGFIQSHLEEIGKAAEGDADAIDALRDALAEDVVMNLKLDDEGIRDDLLSSVQSWQEELDNMGLEVGAVLDDTSFINSMNEMINAAGLSVDQVNALLDSMGFEATFVSEDQSLQTTIPVTTVRHKRTNIGEPDKWGNYHEWTETEEIESIEPKVIEGSYPAFAMSTNGSTPQIQSITKKATGSFNNASGTNKGGNKTSSSGGGSSKEPAHEKPLEREEDIYHTINQELEQIESTLSRIQTINDHEWGLDAQKTLEEEDKLLDQQLDKLKEKKKLQEQDLSSRRKQLEDVGVSFSDDGSAMLNAEGTLDSLYAHYNQMVDMYNAMSAAEQETYKTNLEAEKDRIDKIEKKIDDYESTYSDYQSTLDSILDAHYAEIENEVKQFNNMIDVHLELNEARDEWNDFWYDVVQDVEDTDFVGQINKSIDALETLIGVSSSHIDSTVSVLTNHLLDTISEVQMQIASADNGGNLSIFGDDSALSKETLENYRDQLMEALTAAKEELDEISDNYLNMLDDAQNKIDKQVEAWEAIGAHLEHNAELIKLISGDKSYESLNTIYNQQYQNNLNLLTTQKTSMDYWKDMIDKYAKLLETTEEGSKEWKTYSEAYEKASNNYKEAVADLDKTVEDALNQLNEWKDSQLDAINDAFDRNLSGNLGLDQLEKEWNLINDSADRYLDNVERALGMEDLNKEFDDLLNNTNLTAQAQAELNKMRDEEIARLNEKNKLSQFDIDEVKARLEITKQQLALEDAQKNKSNLRLRRDSQGNYNYQYTGNEGDIEDASEGLMSAKREWYELVKSRNLDLAKAVIENRKNLQSELAALDDMYFENDDARRAKQLEIINKYAEKEKDIMGDAENAKQIFFDGTAKFFADVENNSVLPQWQTTVESLIDAWSNGGESSFTGAVEKGINDIEVTQDEFNSRTAEIMETAGVNYIDLKEKGIDPTKDSLDDLTDSNEDLSDALDDVNDKLKEQEKNLRNCESAYNDLKDAAVNAVKEADQMLNQLAQTVIQTQQQVQAAINSAKSASPITGTGGIYDTGRGSDNKGKSNAKSTIGKKSEYRVTYTDSEGGHSQSDTYTDKSSAKSAAASKLAHGSLHVTLLDVTTKKMVHGDWKRQIDGQDDKEKAAKAIFESFRSGGYTGAWRGSNEANEMKSGKLALLHQKELVLNEDDTKNMLEAVNVLRSVSVDGIADSIINAARLSANILNGVGSGLMQTISNLVQNSSANTNNYRNMTVNADFSGVRSADAIYQALMELENYGMQEAYSNSPISRKAY